VASCPGSLDSLRLVRDGDEDEDDDGVADSAALMLLNS
jgi:hypothetical protein